MGNWLFQSTRRSFLRLLAMSGAAGLTYFWGGGLREAGGLSESGKSRAARGSKPLSPLEKAHTPEIQMPRRAEDGSTVPIIIDMQHDQEPDDYIKTVRIFNFNDPIPSKGTYHFTPANGRVHLTVHTRMHSGHARVHFVIECTKHGKFVTKIPIQVDKGGC
jgi:predicted secreted protein